MKENKNPARSRRARYFNTWSCGSSKNLQLTIVLSDCYNIIYFVRSSPHSEQRRGAHGESVAVGNPGRGEVVVKPRQSRKFSLQIMIVENLMSLYPIMGRAVCVSHLGRREKQIWIWWKTIKCWDNYMWYSDFSQRSELGSLDLVVQNRRMTRSEALVVKL